MAWAPDEKIELNWPPGSLAMFVNAIALLVSVVLEVLMWVGVAVMVIVDSQTNSNALGLGEIITMAVVVGLCTLVPMMVSLGCVVANALGARRFRNEQKDPVAIVIVSVTMVWVLVRMMMSMMTCSCLGPLLYTIALVTSVLAFVLVIVGAAVPAHPLSADQRD